MRFICRDQQQDSNINTSMHSLKRNKKTYHDVSWVRNYLISVYGKKCCYCEISLERPNTSLQIDHFYPENVGKNVPNLQNYVYDIYNFHVSCHRCNKKKNMYNGDINNPPYTGPALSPDYYIDSNGAWQLSNENYIKTHISYKGAVVYSAKYSQFINALKLNGEGNKHKSALLDRAQYLYATQKEIKRCFELANYNKRDARKEFDKIRKKFEPNAEYSVMIQIHFGKAYKMLENRLQKRISLTMLLNVFIREIWNFISNK